MLLAAGTTLASRVEASWIEEAAPPQGRFVAMPGGRLHLTEREPVGAFRGTVVLLHGASGNQADMMLALGDRLASAGFRVLAPDRPGQGWSDRPDGRADASPRRQAALIRQGLSALGVTHAIVVGHSLGGAVATSFALDERDFTDALVLVAPVTHPWPTGIAWYYHVAAAPVLGQFFAATLALPVGSAMLPAGLRAVFAPNPVPPDYAQRIALSLMFRPDAFVANAQDVADLSAFLEGQAPRMSSITVPTAIVTGDHDGVVWTELHSFASHRAIAGSTLTVLPGVGHSPHWSQPDAVISAIQSVAARVAAGSLTR